MQSFRVQTTITKDGKLSIKGLPFQKGEKVDVIVLQNKHAKINERYPLRGKPVNYIDPFGSVAEDEWDALK